MANIKLGNDTISGIANVKVKNADAEGYVNFSEGMSGGHKVTFKVGSDDYCIVSVKDGEKISLPVTPSTAAAIEGWYEEEEFSSKVTFPYTPSVDKTLYAKIVAASNVLNDNSWAVISAVSAEGTGANYWSVGDCKQVHLQGTAGHLSLNDDFNVFILGFDHNSASEGSGISFGGFKTADAQKKDVCLVDEKYNSSVSSTGYFSMNSSNTNVGGWKDTQMRYTVLGSTNVNKGNATNTCATNPASNTLMSCLPSDLRTVMKPITKYTDNVGNKSAAASAVSPTVDYLPLLAEYEVFGTRSRANSNEQTWQRQYAYYGNSSNSKIKYKHNNTTSSAYWWLRSPSSGNADTFCYVSGDGSAYSYYADRSCGAAAAFVV